MSRPFQEAIAAGAPLVALPVADLQIELVRIPAGHFTMGSSPAEAGHSPAEGPARRIRISEPFYVGRYPVTRAQYYALMPLKTPTQNSDTVPVSQIAYAGALDFCRRLSGDAGVDVALPTEAQWEYACRAGTLGPYYSGSTEADLDRVAWYDGNAGGSAHPVGQKLPNAWGLHDTLGNVWEFTADFIQDYADMPETDPVGLVAPTHGGMRGGGWMHGPEECRAGCRMTTDTMFGGAGFRVALKLDSPIKGDSR
ncbi:MAG: formylglycine-generating enzyme family protein [Candidatus Solibacter sp.]